MLPSILIWLGITAFLYALWEAPNYIGRKVYPYVEAELEFDEDAVDIGDTLTVRCILTNPTKYPCPRIKLSLHRPEGMRLPQDAADPFEEKEERIRLETFLMPKQKAELVFSLTASARGVARWNDIHMEFTDFLGLGRFARTVFTGGKVIVRPRRGIPKPIVNSAHELLGEIRTRRYYQEDPSLFTGIRPYQPGDSIRNVSWLSTARSGEISVKQFGHTTSSRVFLVLDGQMFEAYWKLVPRHRLDVMCERVVQIADKLIDDGAAVGLITNLKDSITMSFHELPAGGKGQTFRLANRMGSLSQSPAIPLSELLRLTARYAKPEDSVILLTSFLDKYGMQALSDFHSKHRNLL